MERRLDSAVHLFRVFVHVGTALAIVFSLLRFIDVDHLLLLGIVPLAPVAVAVGLIFLAATYGARALVGAVVGLAIVLGLAMPGTVLPRTGCAVDVSDSTSDFVVYSHNVLVGNQAVDDVAAQLLGANPDVVLLQEATDVFVEALLVELDGNYPHRETQGLQSIVSRWPLGNITTTGTATGGALIATVNAPDLSLRVANFHSSAPLSNERRVNQRVEYESMKQWRDSDSVDIVMGDFNAGGAQPLYRNVVGDGFVDAHRRAGCGFGQTWRRLGTNVALLSLDHALVRESYDVESFEIFDYAGSDHKAIAVRIASAQSD